MDELPSTFSSISLPEAKAIFRVWLAFHQTRLKQSGSYIKMRRVPLNKLEVLAVFIKKADGIYFVHAFEKKTQELPQKEVEVVLKRLKEV